MTKVCVATSDTETFSQLGDLSAKTLRFYANRHSCAARIISNLGNVGRPAAWHRVQWIPELLDEGFDFVFWLDADALFLRFDRDVRELIQEGKDLYMVRHPYDGKVVPNTGVMLATALGPGGFSPRCGIATNTSTIAGGRMQRL